MASDTSPLGAPSRPHMPGYGIHEGSEGMIGWEWVEQQMAEARNYWVCTTRPDGLPHAAPVWGVWLEGALWFGAGRRSRKAINLAASPAVVVHSESGDDVVILEGIAEEVTGDALTPVIEAYAAKYSPFQPDPANEPDGIYYAVRPHTVLAWQETDFPATATRWTRRA